MPKPKDAPSTAASRPREEVLVTEQQTGFRADRALANLAEALGRRAAKEFCKRGLVRLNGRISDGSERVSPGDRLAYPALHAPENRELFQSCVAPRLTTPHGRHLTRLYEDEQILIISKPAEIPVHRGQGGFTRRDTIEDVLQRAYPPRSAAAARTVEDSAAPLETGEEDGEWERERPWAGPRLQPGFFLVHRLDQETSGCLLVAKDEDCLRRLVRDFMERKVTKRYWALVVGEVPWKERIVKRPIRYVRAEQRPLGRSRSGEPDWVRRKKAPPAIKGVKKGVAVEEGQEGKAAETRFRVLQRFKGYTLLDCEPLTGRTHQIRVHLLAEGFPLAYDPLYGRHSPLRFGEFSRNAQEGEAVILNRLPLHARALGFAHPLSGERVQVEAPLPRDLREFLRVLKKYRAQEPPPQRRRRQR